MAEIITKGYLVARRDYDVFDEILTFINEHGNRFVMFAPGTKRITSKNARALFFGNYLEIQFFHATNETKLSKLKKVIPLDQIDYKYENTYSMLILSELMSKVIDFNVEFYQFYQLILQYIILEYNDYYISCFLLVKFLIMNGINFNFRSCAYCNSSKNIKTFSLVDRGLVCVNCESKIINKIDYDPKALQLWQKLYFASQVQKEQIEDNELTFKGLLKILNSIMYDQLGIYLTIIKNI
ncbi:DNA repair protein RecO [Ureaplasma urealyticum]|uniref:DNA repair protein RecO n=2 Tax=Ureaplasma urealyticum TaxID=2130 RepID=A0AAP9D7J2_UREUR|nr:DNA repair protein RecO [Ureaplasma urealyticum]ACI60121.1 DNA repair protein RecO [Ureaplasma urealyticum serovar 10 str. ATCC 33699]EDT49616.1 DNA repair protein RecO [Ureaplasma urealyticum serovar 13 str. ATCC 33698]EDX53132.1 DNA repair protein RecO [Ureaplasma urealyticum serovar 12 str. ATCC 33696]EDY74787.1 DNA repair protein RecO [Ureaplasma urealyticum serovar 4 str. ATCC 27816]EEH02339.1 DNA repair protein RecO [Ureaplasma urealyticum serovar 2 str. ATCC 27814]